MGDHPDTHSVSCLRLDKVTSRPSRTPCGGLLLRAHLVEGVSMSVDLHLARAGMVFTVSS